MQLVKINRITEVSMHERFLENFIKSSKINLVTYRNMSNVQVFSTRESLTWQRSKYQTTLHKEQSYGRFFELTKKLRNAQRVSFALGKHFSVDLVISSDIASWTGHIEALSMGGFFRTSSFPLVKRNFFTDITLKVWIVLKKYIGGYIMIKVKIYQTKMRILKQSHSTEARKTGNP